MVEVYDGIVKGLQEVIEYQKGERDLRKSDWVEVVRCGDCKYYSEDGWGFGNCCRPNVDYLRMNENGFCSWGERREER